MTKLLGRDTRYNLLTGNQSLNGEWASGNCPSGETICSGNLSMDNGNDSFNQDMHEPQINDLRAEEIQSHYRIDDVGAEYKWITRFPVYK